MRVVTRRRFIQTGVAGAVVLAAARWLDAPRALAASPSSLDAGALEVIRALVPVVLAGALPAEPDARARATRETVEAFDRAVAGLAPAVQEELREMLSLLAFAPTRRAMAGLRSPWPEAKSADIAVFLEDWRRSRFELKRAGYRALTQLIQGAWYDNPLAWAVVGYPGPPALTRAPS